LCLACNAHHIDRGDTHETPFRKRHRAQLGLRPVRRAGSCANAADLQRYGLNAEDAAQVQVLQQQGHQVRVLTAEETEQYKAGMSNRTWWIIGGVVLIAAIVVASN
jgi:hypothetical protein